MRTYTGIDLIEAVKATRNSDKGVAYNLAKIETILSYGGVDINARSNTNCTALMYAAFYARGEKYIEILQLLVNAGADLNFQGFGRGHENYTALMYATRYSNTTSSIEAVRLLVNAGATIDTVNAIGQTPLMYASLHAKNSVDIVQLLLDAGAMINATCNQGCTPLMYATANSSCTSSIEAVKLLIDAGADMYIDMKSSQTMHKGFTALMYACKYANNNSSMETVQTLVQAGADLDSRDSIGWTALMHSTRASTEEVLQILIDAGASITQKDYDVIEKSGCTFVGDSRSVLMNKLARNIGETGLITIRYSDIHGDHIMERLEKVLKDLRNADSSNEYVISKLSNKKILSELNVQSL
jgi:ankyrin repeat protein